MRWTITVFIFLIVAVVVASFCGHIINDTIRQLLTDLGYVVIGGGAVRKGVEVAGQVTSKWAPPTPNSTDTREP
jgi:succinate dehydrogenase/fumarate reductase cytochrome b subunit